ncbi:MULTISPECIES: hypothetical protein [Bacillaceae]
MKVKYAERGTFDPDKAARGLIELFNKTYKQNSQENKPPDRAEIKAK